jgi:hypothetical protein
VYKRLPSTLLIRALFVSLTIVLSVPFARAIPCSERLGQQNVDVSLQLQDPFFYLKGAQTPDKETLYKQYSAIMEHNGEGPVLPHMNLDQMFRTEGPYRVGFLFGKNGTRKAYFTEDAVVEAPNHANYNGSRRAYLFEKGKLVKVIPLSEYLLSKIHSDQPAFKLIRKMSKLELSGWRQGDMAKLAKMNPNVPRTEYNLSTFGSQVVWFSLEIPIWHEVEGTETITLYIPKAKLLEWAHQEKIVVGFLSLNSFIDIVFLENTWQELLSYFPTANAP